MVMTPVLLTRLAEALARWQPHSLIYCADEPIPALAKLADEGCDIVHVRNFSELEGQARFDVGIVLDYLEAQPLAEGTQLLGRLRNLHCAKIWVAVARTSQWDFNAMLGLGFQREPSSAALGGEVCIYSYDLGTYNKKREWNTPKYWANPQNWGKYWW